jgi:hypothetical protein
MEKMVHLMKFMNSIVILIGFAFFFGPACAKTISEKELKLSEAAARSFQDKIFSGKIDDLYNNHFDADVKKSVTNENFKGFIEKLKGALGGRKNSVLFNYKKINNEVIRVSFMSDFDRGVSVESFYIKILPQDKYSLFRYEMTDPSKFSF